ncbi:MAG: hypothetical protein M1836_000747 [Candelina mexicana]|nr:MAG: hypothetical protein M1836_000747 [Candelina mexicana]
MPVQTRSQSHSSASSYQTADGDQQPQRGPRVHRVSTSVRSSIASPTESTTTFEDDQPPTYTINLGLPPAQRYVQLAKDFKPLIAKVAWLFDSILLSLHPNIPVRSVKAISRKLLRRLYSEEETEELRGISKAADVEIFLLVALNTFLDLFMGCTSGGVRVNGNDQDPRMLHFRTLDWDMDSLRKMVVRLEFVHEEGGEVFATSITYAGFIGILTGVRKGLSLSLNFRPNHNVSSPLSHIRFYGHHVLVLLGLRPSISSILRSQFLPPYPARNKRQEKPSTPAQALPTLEPITTNLPSIPSTACYIIFSDGNTAVTLEKDHRTAVIRSASDFIVATNHDRDREHTSMIQEDAQHTGPETGMQALVEESVDRKECVQDLWKEDAFKSNDDPTSQDGDLGNGSVSQEQVINWMGQYPILNECTHFAVLMDPREGKVLWLKRRLEAYSAPDVEDSTDDIEYRRWEAAPETS